MLTLLLFLLVLSVLVFVHEFGHFIMAKRAKLRVDEFGFGFPPRIVGIQKVNGRRRIIFRNSKDVDPRDGNTIYSINALPFGGFVRIKGEAGEGKEDADSFANRKASTRIGIIAAGVIMNALLAVVLIAGGYIFGFPQVIDENISKYARVRDVRIEILNVLEESPADIAGIEIGDRLIAGNNEDFKNAEGFKEFVDKSLDKPVQLKVEREGVQREIQVVPIVLEQTKKPGIGIALADIGDVRYPVWLAIPESVKLTAALFKAITLAIGGIIKDAILGQPVTAELAGPVGIAVLTGQAAKQGFVALLQFMAVLSINLAFLNIIPFPALDGGRILFILIEKVIRRPVPRRVEGWIHSIGFILLISLVLFITYRDLGRYSGGIVQFFRGIVQ